MKVLQLPGSLSREGGGVFQVALNHSLQLQQLSKYSVEVIGKHDRFIHDDESKWNGIKTTPLKLSIPIVHHIDGLFDAIELAKPDIIHSHMLWTSQSRVIKRYNSIYKTPYVVTPHGMLDAWTINSKKKIALKLFERRSLESAACIHALNFNEYETIRRLGIKTPVAIIPNGISIENSHTLFKKKPKNKKTLLFLSRIDPKKGLEPLIKAMAEIRPKFENSYEMHIHGWGEENYIKSIQDLITKNNLIDSIKIKGPVFDKKKSQTYQNSDAFILPSYSEGFPMVILEAWSHSKPVLMTSACNIPEGFSCEAAIEIDLNKEILKDQLLDFFKLTDTVLQVMGKNGKRLVEEKFTWHRVGQNLEAMYDWILSGSKKPDFIMLN